jgi:hypothetical protein
MPLPKPKSEDFSTRLKKVDKNALPPWYHLTKINRKYLFQIEQEFKKIAELFSLKYKKKILKLKLTLLLSKQEFPLIAYRPSCRLVMTTFNYQDLKFLEIALCKYPKLFTSESAIAHLVRAIYSLSPIEKN